jgi:hypothetical protein
MKWLEVLKSHPKKDKKSTYIIDIKKTVQYSSIIRRLAVCVQPTHIDIQM